MGMHVRIQEADFQHPTTDDPTHATYVAKSAKGYVLLRFDGEARTMTLQWPTSVSTRTVKVILENRLGIDAESTGVVGPLKIELEPGAGNTDWILLEVYSNSGMSKPYETAPAYGKSFHTVQVIAGFNASFERLREVGESLMARTHPSFGDRSTGKGHLHSPFENAPEVRDAFFDEAQSYFEQASEFVEVTEGSDPTDDHSTSESEYDAPPGMTETQPVVHNRGQQHNDDPD